MHRLAGSMIAGAIVLGAWVGAADAQSGAPLSPDDRLTYGKAFTAAEKRQWSKALDAAAEGRLSEIALNWRDEAAMVVVMAANGYPGSYEKGSVIGNLDAAAADPDVTILHAGTKFVDGQVAANGGRVLGVTALGSSVKVAQTKAYTAVDAIDWPEGFCRRDIGWRAIAREK